MTTTKMNPDVKAAWVAALRSGDYEQGTHWLRRGDKYCCLGVLCELAVKAAVPVEVETDGDDDGSVTTYDDESAGLPDSVIDWAGLEENPDTSLVRLPNDDVLSGLNDGGRSFKYIAHRIEKGL